MAAGRGRSSPQGSGELATSTSQPTLPSVSSAYPLRRAPSLTSREASSAEGHWQSLLRNRLGTPGEPPGRDALPSLYDPNRAAPRPASGLSRSVPPSSIGPSASIVAWFAQFQCETCGRIPTSLDARYCFSCGQPLPLPELPRSGAESACGVNRSRSAKDLGEVATAAEAAAAQERRSDPGLRRGPQAGAPARTPTRRPGGGEGKCCEQGAGAVAANGAGRCKATPARPPRPPVGSNVDAHHPRLHWKDRESQCAVWLGNIRPRKH